MKRKVLRILLIIILLIVSVLFLFYLQLKPFLPFLAYLTGRGQASSYIILLQNDTELRANGGFTGSYAKAIVTSIDYLHPQIDLTFQDIYVPNGQLKGHVTPPAPIQTAFQHGTWELANADWEPDFPTAAKAIRWFFVKGNEIDPDLLVTLNLTTVKKLLDIIGPFYVPIYKATITPENVYAFLQSQAETNFFPGSTQKKDALTAVGLALKQKVLHLSPIQYLKIARIILFDLDHTNLLINSKDQNFQSFLEAKHWAGKIIPGDLDTYMMVETNLGANKANCCIERQTKHTITKENNTYLHRVHLSLTNQSTGQNNPPFDFTGYYLAYLRFYLPPDAWNIEVMPQQSSPAGQLVPNQKVTKTKNFGLTELGFFQTTAVGTTSTVDLSYELATGSAQTPYDLKLIKQNGLFSSPQTVIYQGRSKSYPLTHTLNLSF